MPLIQLIVLALIQGITEFLPVSSSAHLILAPLLVETWQDQGPLIDVAAHVGSLFAVMVYFRAETLTLIRGGLDFVRMKDTQDRRLFFLISMATVPILVIGGAVAAFDLLDELRSPRIIGTAFIVFGALLWHADQTSPTKNNIEKMSWRDAWIIGISQIMAVVPGSSRSGVTMTAARYLGWSRTEAARFSMLIAIPTISASGLFAGVSLMSDGGQESMMAALIVAALSFISALAAVAVFMRLTKTMSFTPFVIYRFVLGALLIAFAGRLG